MAITGPLYRPGGKWPVVGGKLCVNARSRCCCPCTDITIELVITYNGGSCGDAHGYCSDIEGTYEITGSGYPSCSFVGSCGSFQFFLIYDAATQTWGAGAVGPDGGWGFTGYGEPDDVTSNVSCVNNELTASFTLNGTVGSECENCSISVSITTV